MSYRTPVKVLALLLLTTASAVAQSAVSCSSSDGTGRLTGFALFTGDPRQKLELAPNSVSGAGGSYTNTWPLRSSVGLVAVCRYADGKEQQIPLPRTITSCKAQGSSRQLQAACQ